MSRKLLLSGLSAEVVAWHDALPTGARSAIVDAVLRGYLALPADVRKQLFPLPAVRLPVTDEQIAAALKAANGNKAEAARALGVHYDTIMARLRARRGEHVSGVGSRSGRHLEQQGPR